jgi:hypothetical protein
MNRSNAKTGQIQLSRKALWIWTALALVLLGAWALWRYASTSSQPWLVRWRVGHFLKSHSETRNFKIEFPFPTRTEMAAKAPDAKPGTEPVSRGKLTGKDFDTLKGEYIKLKLSALGLERKTLDMDAALAGRKEGVEKWESDLAEARKGTNTERITGLEKKAKNVRERLTALEANSRSIHDDLKNREDALAPLVSDLWDFQRGWLADEEAAEASGASRLAKARALLSSDMRQKLDEANSYTQIYQGIGEELWVAARLLSSANADHRRIGMSLALEAGQIAQNDAQNGWLAGRICEAYIWPYARSTVGGNRRSAAQVESLLNDCADILRRNDEWPTVVRNYEVLLAVAVTPQMADSARAQIAMAHERAGDPRNALRYLRAIERTNDWARLLRNIPRLERQLKGG